MRSGYQKREERIYFTMEEVVLGVSTTYFKLPMGNLDFDDHEGHKSVRFCLHNDVNTLLGWKQF